MSESIAEKVKAKARRLEARAKRLEDVEGVLFHLRECSGPGQSYPLLLGGQMKLGGMRGAHWCFKEFKAYVESNWQHMRSEMIAILEKEAAEIRAEFEGIQDAPEIDHD